VFFVSLETTSHAVRNLYSNKSLFKIDTHYIVLIVFSGYNPNNYIHQKGIKNEVPKMSV